MVIRVVLMLCFKGWKVHYLMNKNKPKNLHNLILTKRCLCNNYNPIYAKLKYNTLTKNYAKASLYLKYYTYIVLNKVLTKVMNSLYAGLSQAIELYSNTHKFKSKWKPRCH